MLYYLLHSIVSSMFIGTRGDHDCLSFYFQDRSFGAHKEIVLASLFCFQVDLRRHTRRFCLPFFYDWFDIRYMTFLSDHSMLAHVTGVSSLLQRFSWDYQYFYFLVPVNYHCAVSTRS